MVQHCKECGQPIDSDDALAATVKEGSFCGRCFCDTGIQLPVQPPQLLRAPEMEAAIIRTWKTLAKGRPLALVSVVAIMGALDARDGSVQEELVRMVREGKVSLAKLGNRRMRRKQSVDWKAAVILRPSECPGHDPGRYTHVWLNLEKCGVRMEQVPGKPGFSEPTVVSESTGQRGEERP